MARGFSKVVIVGNLTRDPELRSTNSGNSVCSFSVAVDRSYTGSDGEKKGDVSFFNCSAWGQIGERIAKYAKKGSGVIVSGRLQQRSYEAKDGTKRSVVEIIAEDFSFIGGGRRDDNAGSTDAGEEVAPDDVPDEEIDLSDVPF